MNLSDLQKIKEQVSIRDVAESLLHLEKQDGKYKYPGERTASIQLYTDTQSFNDFGRNVGGDIFKLVSHIEGIDFKESLDEIVNFFQIRDVENKDEESSRPRWINYLEEKKKCRYIEHYNYSLISLKGEYLGYAFTKVRVMHQIKKKDDNGDEVLIWDKTLIYGTLNGDYIKCKLEKKAKLLPEYLGAEDSDYTYQVMRLWMLGAVSRVYKPGNKFDYTIILQGSQGIGKSTFLKLMALDDSWFNDSLDSLDSDKAVQSLTGSWIIELAELKSLARTAGGVESVKRFLTATQDKYRIPYERRADTFYRQCVFAGTTNKDDFLQDETGNRRFLIIHTGVTKPFKSLFIPEAMDDIKQAWAEAVHIWKNEDPQLILPENCMQQAKELQEANMADDGKRGIILDYLEGKTQVCAREIWFEALEESISPKSYQTSEINSIIAKVPGWQRMKTPRKFPKNKTVNIIEQNEKEVFMDGCNENVIEFMTNGTRATLSFSQGRYKSAIRRLAEKHPEDCRIIADNEDGSICAHVPVSWLRISPPRQYTEEQRQQMGERLRQNRSENTATQG